MSFKYKAKIKIFSCNKKQKELHYKECFLKSPPKQTTYRLCLKGIQTNKLYGLDVT